jgi:hypothetical protein
MASWNRGDRVVQATYGRVTVIDINEQHIVVHFDDCGRRKFSIELVVLQASDEPEKRALPMTQPGMPRGTSTNSNSTATAVGFENSNGQMVIRQTNLSGNLPGQRLYVLKCGKCGHRYGANGGDVHNRLCPSCMGGPPGLVY